MSRGDTFAILASKHITYDFHEVKPNVWDLFVYENGEIVELLEREDDGGRRLAAIGLFALLAPCRKDINSTEIDRLLFL